jgi:hypothetical protein
MAFLTCKRFPTIKGSWQLSKLENWCTYHLLLWYWHCTYIHSKWLNGAVGRGSVQTSKIGKVGEYTHINWSILPEKKEERNRTILLSLFSGRELKLYICWWSINENSQQVKRSGRKHKCSLQTSFLIGHCSFRWRTKSGLRNQNDVLQALQLTTEKTHPTLPLLGC